jgi:hypothetical protein
VRFAQEGADIVALDVCGPVETVVIPHSTPADLEQTAAGVAATSRVLDGNPDAHALLTKGLAGAP